MSESKFTPGPWHVDGFHMSAVIRETETGWERIAECDSDMFRHTNWRNNARLIAAAPELFEALRELVAIRTIKDKLEEPNNGDWPDMAALRERTDAAWTIARAALLKASPEQSE